MVLDNWPTLSSLSILRYSLMTALRIVAVNRGRTMNQPAIVKTVISLVYPQVKRPTLVYLGSASYDKEAPYQVQTTGYHTACDVISLNVSKAMKSIPSTTRMQQTIASAHIILVSGGNTRYAIHRWKARGLDAMTRTAAEHKVVLSGGSTGAICWFDDGHSDSMDPTTFIKVDPHLTEEQRMNWAYIRVGGLGYLQALCVPHHNTSQSNRVPRSQDSDQMMIERPEQPCLGIEENAAFVVEGNRAWVVSTDGIAKCCLKRCQPKEGGGYSILAQDLKVSTGSILLSNLWKGMF